MNTLVGRTPRVLLVAAMSTSALVGATATAGAAERSDPALADCHDPEVLSFAIPVATDRSVCNSAAGKVRSILLNAMGGDDTLRVAEPSIMKVFDLLDPELRDCDVPTMAVVDGAQPAESVTGTDLAAVVGTPAEDPEPLEEPAPEVVMMLDSASAGPAAETSAAESVDAVEVRSAESGVAEAVGGVEIEERAVAPEQMEVVGPPTAATGGLPATGSDGPALALFGLAMVVSGAAARWVARD